MGYVKNQSKEISMSLEQNRITALNTAAGMASITSLDGLLVSAEAIAKWLEYGIISALPAEDGANEIPAKTTRKATKKEPAPEPELSAETQAKVNQVGDFTEVQKVAAELVAKHGKGAIGEVLSRFTDGAGQAAKKLSDLESRQFRKFTDQVKEILAAPVVEDVAEEYDPLA